MISLTVLYYPPIRLMCVGGGGEGGFAPTILNAYENIPFRFVLLLYINPSKPNVLFVGHDTDQTPRSVASEQLLHFSLTECSIKI